MKNKKGLNVLSLFDGMSCGRIALGNAGITINKYFASEVDPYAIKVSQANYPDTMHLGDVRFVTAPKDITIDLLIGGSPCQGFSFASKDRLNFKDPRSKLFWEFVRILKECKPRYFLLENVKMKKESMDVITKALGVKPVFINSSLVSAQNRQRYYWTNIPFTMPKDRGIMLKDILENGVVDRDKAHCIDANYFKGGNLKSYFEKHRRQLVFPKILQVPHGWNKGGLKALRGKVPTMTTSGWQHNNHLTFDDGKTYRKLTPMECERLQTVPDNYTNHVSNTQRYKMLGNGWTVEVVAEIFKGLKEKNTK